jgi:tRNA G37 N-methylase Trm5
MFAGIGVYPIVIYKYKRPMKIVGIELGRECCKYFKENLAYLLKFHE